MIVTSSEVESDGFARELAALSSYPAGKFLYRSDLNLSRCARNQLCPGRSSEGAAGERTLCVK